MHPSLPAQRPPACQNVSIGVTAEEKRLEKQHACSPYGGSASKPGQDIFADERLDQEKKECAEKHCCAIKQHMFTPMSDFSLRRDYSTRNRFTLKAIEGERLDASGTQVLPAPLGPINPKISPSFTLRFIMSTAVGVGYFLLSFLFQ
jgi:hypothetical protein